MSNSALTPQELANKFEPSMLTYKKTNNSRKEKQDSCKKAFEKILPLLRFVKQSSEDFFEYFEGLEYGSLKDAGLIISQENEFFLFDVRSDDNDEIKTICKKKQPAKMRVRMNDYYNIETRFESPYYLESEREIAVEEVNPMSFDNHVLYNRVQQFIKITAEWEHNNLHNTKAKKVPFGI